MASPNINVRVARHASQDQLNILLKDVPDKGDHDYYISAAMILRAGLQKDYKCADDPWSIRQMKRSVYFGIFLMTTSGWAQVKVATISDDNTASSKAVVTTVRAKITSRRQQ